MPENHTDIARDLPAECPVLAPMRYAEAAVISSNPCNTSPTRNAWGVTRHRSTSSSSACRASRTATRSARLSLASRPRRTSTSISVAAQEVKKERRGQLEHRILGHAALGPEWMDGCVSALSRGSIKGSADGRNR